MTDQTNKMAEERYPYKPGELSCVPFQREDWASGYTEGLKAGGWVKASERTPVDYLLKCLKFTAPDIACEKGFVECMSVGRYNVASKEWIINSRSPGDDVQDLKWFDETLLPDEQEIASKAWDACELYQRKWAEFRKYDNDEIGAPNLEEYLKSIKKD